MYLLQYINQSFRYTESGVNPRAQGSIYQI